MPSQKRGSFNDGLRASPDLRNLNRLTRKKKQPSFSRILSRYWLSRRGFVSALRTRNEKLRISMASYEYDIVSRNCYELKASTYRDCPHTNDQAWDLKNKTNST